MLQSHATGQIKAIQTCLKLLLAQNLLSGFFHWQFPNNSNSQCEYQLFCNCRLDSRLIVDPPNEDSQL